MPTRVHKVDLSELNCCCCAAAIAPRHAILHALHVLHADALLDRIAIEAARVREPPELRAPAERAHHLLEATRPLPPVVLAA